MPQAMAAVCPYSLVPPTPSAKASLHYICRLSTTEGPLASEFDIGRCLHRHMAIIGVCAKRREAMFACTGMAKHRSLQHQVT